MYAAARPCQSGTEGLHNSPETGACVHSEVGSWRMLGNVTPGSGFLCPNCSSFGSLPGAGFVDLGMQVEAADDGKAACELLSWAVCSLFEDHAADTEEEQLVQSPRLVLVF